LGFGFSSNTGGTGTHTGCGSLGVWSNGFAMLCRRAGVTFVPGPAIPEAGSQFLEVSNIDQNSGARKSMLVPSPPLIGTYR
jgi:hypothetical protein